MSDPVPSATGTTGSTATLLIVDDDASTRMMARAFLERAGFAVDEAANGQEALERLDRVHPDLVLLDVDMPVLNGFETCARLRQRDDLRHVPVLMLTGLDNDEAISRAYEVGATDFASKPINWSLLCHRLRYMLRASLAARALEDSRAGLAAAQRIARLGDWELDPATGSMRWSDELYRILGRSPVQSSATLDNFIALIRSSDRPRFTAAIDEVTGGSGRASLDVALRIDEHTELHARQDIVRVAAGGGNGLRLRGVLQDFTERRRTERRIEQLAYFDSLSGLPNRVRFNDMLAAAMADKNCSALAVLFLDLNDFKRVNDTFGHATGDALLKEAARRLSALTSARDNASVQTMVARMGGDEFTVLVRGVPDVETLRALAAEAIQALGIPFAVRGQTLFVTPRVGIALRDETTSTPEHLLRNADRAKCAARRDGKGTIRVHDDAMDDEAQRRHALDVELRRALERDELSIHYQPQLDLASSRVYSCEALLRWTSGSLGPVYPDEFIPLAEENGCILEIGAWVLERACRDALTWPGLGLPIENVAVNVSVQQFMEPGFADRVRDTLDRTGLAPHRLELEITESLLAAQTETAVATLAALKRIGVALSIDDFGTGYSSLSQLKHFPIDRIKIDRSFITDVDTDEQDATITRTIIAMGRSLGLRVLAEGVETEAQLNLLIDAGCDEIQGYWLGRPQPVAGLIDDLGRIEALLHGLRPDEHGELRLAV